MTREEAIRILASSCIPGSKQTEALETLIPELRESEDERIRKQLIEAIKIGRSNSGISFTEEAASRFIAWLEKHSEEEIKKIRNEEYTNGFNDAAGFRKQKERKPASYSPLCNTIKDKIREYVANNFVTDTVVKTDVKSIVKAMEEGVRLGKEEQKPAEDKELLKNILFQKKGITYDDYKCKNDPYVGLSFYELIKCLEEYDKARSNR